MPNGFSINVAINDAETARIALRMLRLTKSVRTRLLDFIASVNNPEIAHEMLRKGHCSGLPGQKRLEAKLAAVLASSGETHYLLSAFDFNPKGEMRRQLLDGIGQKASIAEKAVHSLKTLSFREKMVLMRRAVDVKHTEYRASRALNFLSTEGLPDDMRQYLVKNLVHQGYGPFYVAQSVLNNPQEYFPASAPVTTAERTFLLGYAIRNGEWCARILRNYGAGGREESPALSEDEAKQALVSTHKYLELAGRGGYSTHQQSLAEGILTNKKLVPLLTTKQLQQLKTVQKNAA